MKLSSFVHMLFAFLAALAVGLAAAAVNINTASEAELTALPGIGPAKAKAIVAYRTQNGAFKSADDLVKVSGIGGKTLERLKPEVTVEAVRNRKADVPAVKK